MLQQPSFKIKGLLVLEKIFEDFHHIWVRWLSWSCDLDHLYKLFVPPSYEGSTSGFVQKHENELPGLFQDNSRTFLSFQGLNFIDFQAIFDCFCRKQ